MTSQQPDEPRPPTPGVVNELKAISHDVFNLMTVMYGLQEILQSMSVADENYARAIGDFNQVVNRMQQIGARLLKLYREEGQQQGGPGPSSHQAQAH